MNLQVCAPHQECVYNCPFCVARGHKHKYHFKDIYKDGLNQDYFNALKRTIKNCNIDTVIVTGECDPTQNMRWARKVAEVAKSCGGLNMRLIRNLEKDIFVDEFGNTYTTDQVFAIFSKDGDFLKIRTVNNLPKEKEIDLRADVKRRRRQFNKTWDYVEKKKRDELLQKKREMESAL